MWLVQAVSDFLQSACLLVPVLRACKLMLCLLPMWLLSVLLVVPAPVSKLAGSSIPCSRNKVFGISRLPYKLACCPGRHQLAMLCM